MLLLLLASCLPLPALTPPLDTSFTFGPAVSAEGAAPALDMRLGVQPLALVPDQLDRLVDPSIGAVIVIPDVRGGEAAVGGYARVGYRFWGRELRDDEWVQQRAYAQVHAGPDMLWANEPWTGGSVGARIAWVERRVPQPEAEWTLGQGGWVGVRAGETGIGAEVLTSLAFTPDGPRFFTGLGIVVGVPASAGVCLVPL